jgi:tryptophan synthase alpha chain
MNRLVTSLNRLRQRREKALVTFITAGDPDLAMTGELIPLLSDAGADIIELGIPFSDPVADGPTIQLSSERSLAAGTTLEGILDTVRQARRRTAVPIVLMGYINTVHAYGYERFARDAVSAGVDGVLLVDMPPEEAASLLPCARTSGLNVIFLLTPTSDPSRVAMVKRMGRGFVYYVTVTGVTGARTAISGTLADELTQIRGTLRLPVMAGFGISTPGQAVAVAAHADGVVVGSVLVRLFEQHSGDRLKTELKGLVTTLKQAIS